MAKPLDFATWRGYCERSAGTGLTEREAVKALALWADGESPRECGKLLAIKRARDYAASLPKGSRR